MLLHLFCVEMMRKKVTERPVKSVGAGRHYLSGCQFTLAETHYYSCQFRQADCCSFKFHITLNILMNDDIDLNNEETSTAIRLNPRR